MQQTQLTNTNRVK